MAQKGIDTTQQNLNMPSKYQNEINFLFSGTFSSFNQYPIYID